MTFVPTAGTGNVVVARAIGAGLALAALFAPAFERTAEACAPVGPRGVAIEIAEEEALIAWNADTKTEHFIRRAAFTTTAKDFGFLVPTPSLPELTEVDASLFKALRAYQVPEVVRIEGPLRPEVGCSALYLSARTSKVAAPAAGAPEGVTVLATAKVAGYEASILEATDAGLLAKWLVDRGYDTRPSLRSWLEPYVAAQWKLTAFKYIGGDQAKVVGTNAVRMSFTTDRPFYPYREPRDVREGAAPNRSLRVFFLTAAGRMEATLGTSGRFAGMLEMSAPVVVNPSIATALPGSVPASMWLSVWNDQSKPRLGTDEVYFKRAADQTPLPVPPIVITTPHTFFIPVDLIVGTGIVVATLVVFLARRKRA